MLEHVKIRASRPDDLPQLKTIYAQAFPDEDLYPLVRELTNGNWPALSYVASSEGEVVGHICFTSCHVAPAGKAVSLLAPLCAAPALHRQGIGTALVQHGFDALRKSGIREVLVLGDPAYYGRFGFAACSRIDPPFELPNEWKAAWQFVRLLKGTPALSGKLSVPAPWNVRELWAP